MTDDPLILARKRAERAVEGMTEGALKTAAFQTILSKLLNDDDPGVKLGEKVSRATPGKNSQPGTLSGRVLALKSEGFFKTQRSLAEVREALGSHGWHYPLTTMSGAMQSLVRRRLLRRERVNEGRKAVWRYSNP